MDSRAKLRRQALSLQAQAFREGSSNQTAWSAMEAEEILSDLHRLRRLPESKNSIEELYLRFLARCRLLVIDKYHINGFIGAGSCGAVFRAFHLSQPKAQIALKILFFPRNNDEVRRFEKEGDLLHSFNCSHIVRGLSGSRRMPFLPISWYAMELVDNAQTLDQFAMTSKWSDVLWALALACEGLEYAHSRLVVHRDLHFENIMVLADNSIRILDFGSAHHRFSDATFRPMGWLQTCAPEAFFDPKSVTGQADIFSIGTMLYKLVNDSWPFHSASFGELVKKMETCSIGPVNSEWKELNNLVTLCLSRDPAMRPNAGKLAADLRTLSEAPKAKSEVIVSNDKAVSQHN
jgi:serine/threonine protein kinase